MQGFCQVDLRGALTPLTPVNKNSKSSKTITPKTFKRFRATINDSVANKTGHEGSCWFPKQKTNGRGHSQIKFKSDISFEL